MNKNAIYIPSIDAKDLYMANNFIDHEASDYGFRLKTRNGDHNLNKYINALDYSLDQIHLREIAETKLPKKDGLTFEILGKEYSNKVINVTFKYAYKHFNKIKRNTYVADGYMLSRLQFHDSIALNEYGELVGIITNEEVMSVTNKLPKYFTVGKDDTGKTVYKCKTVPAKESVKALRRYLYENGFTCEGRKYVRFKRSSGSARVGKCLFIDERLYNAMHKWEMCELDIKKNDKVDLAALEAYISLPLSSLIGTLDISPKNILVVPDYESIFKDDCIVTEITEDCWLNTTEKEVTVSNSIFDGQSLIDISLMGEYSPYGMVLLRNKFFKSCCFNTNITQWFRDNNIKELSQLHKDSITIADSIDDIKLITTPNSIKYVKFGSILDWLNILDGQFGVVKHEKKTHFFNGNMVQAHYQLLNTVRLSQDEVEELLSDSLDYISKLNTMPEVMRYHIKCKLLDSETPEECVDMSMKTKNEIIYKMMGMSEKFPKTKLYYDFKKETCKTYINNMKRGHLLINGNYSVLLGNPYEMLLQSIGEFDGNTSLPPGHIHTIRYDFDKTLLGCRSPHVSTSNILITENMRHDLIDRYFNLTDEIVCINSINENILERLAGADFDSDAVIISDNEILINAAKKYYEMFKVPVNHVAAKKVNRIYNAAHQADLDFRTSSNKIGEIINLSQELNTIMWETINSLPASSSESEIYDSIKEVYYDVCQLSIMSGIEIDKAKKEFDVDADQEIKKIKEKHIKRDSDNRTIKPNFLGFIAKTKGYYDPTKKNYRYHNTAMDHILRAISKRRATKSKGSDFIPFSECFRFDEYNIKLVKYGQVKKILNWCYTTYARTAAIWTCGYYDLGTKVIMSNREKSLLYAKINNLKLSLHTLYYLVGCVDNPKHSKIARLIFFALFNYGDMMNVFVNTIDLPTTYLVAHRSGDMELYGMRFSIIDAENCKK